VQLDHVFRCNSRALMQIIDVLGDHSRRLAGAVKACQRKMSATGARAGEMRLHREASPPGFVAHVLAGEEFIERDRPVFRPQPPGRAEVRNATLGRNSGAGERNDHARPLHQLLEPVDGRLDVGRDHV
jgi:hypothetical protein